MLEKNTGSSFQQQNSGLILDKNPGSIAAQTETHEGQKIPVPGKTQGKTGVKGLILSQGESRAGKEAEAETLLGMYPGLYKERKQQRKKKNLRDFPFH
jgi:hypothetical protein